MINNEHNGADKVDTSRQSSFESQLFLHPHDGILRCVPVGWQFPLCTVAIAYCLWHFGDQVKKIGPLKFLDNQDASFATISDGNKVIWCGCKRGMQYIDEFRILMKRLDGTAKSRGFLQLPLSREKVLIALEQCKDCLGISPLTPKGRIRRIAGIHWSTVHL